jgi:peptide/nickel transport system permease protein
MLAFLLRRLLWLVPTWVFVAIISFLIIRLTPGDPAAVLLGQESAEGIARIRERLGLDEPMLVQLWIFLRGLLRLDLGESFFLGQSVWDALMGRIPVTLSLALLSTGFAVMIGLPLGILASLRPNTPSDTTIMFVSLIGLSIPEFVLGLSLIFVMAVTWGVLPSGGFVPIGDGVWPWFRHLAMPAVALGFMQSAYLARITRSSMLEVLASDYVRTARAKGLRGYAVVLKHALKNAIIPVLTALGLVFAMLMSGAFITEALFRLPGTGTLVINAVKRRDYPVVQGSLLFITTLVLVVNLAIDSLYAVVDPGIRYD